MSKFSNKKKEGFLRNLPEWATEDTQIPKKMKFNFSFFDGNQEPGQDFSELTKSDVLKVIDKLKNFSGNDVSYWRNQRCGGGGLKMFAEYGSFPKNSDFNHPRHVPHDVMWARFRLEAKFRLIGFLVPSELHDKACSDSGYCFDRNTFYVVFLDKQHRFYKKEND